MTIRDVITAAAFISADPARGAYLTPYSVRLLIEWLTTHLNGIED